MDAAAEPDDDALYRDGMTARREGRPDDALRIAEELLEHRHSGGFELRALVLGDRGDTEEAVACLEEGVERAPGVWLLWELLGNYRSDLGRYDAAAAAYEEALACPDAGVGWIRLNQGVLLGRRGRPEEGLAVLATVEDPDLRERVLAARLGLLSDLQRHEEVQTAGSEFVERDLDPDVHDPESVSWILLHVAESRRALDDDPDGVRDCALRAIAWDPESSRALGLLRELDARRADGARAWNVFMDGRDAQAPGVGFIVMHTVVAETAWAAFEFAREIEEAIGYDDLELDEVEPRDDDVPPDALQGVYDVGRRQAYASKT